MRNKEKLHVEIICIKYSKASSFYCDTHIDDFFLTMKNQETISEFTMYTKDFTVYKTFPTYYVNSKGSNDLNKNGRFLVYYTSIQREK